MPYSRIEKILQPFSITAGIHVYGFSLSSDEVTKEGKELIFPFQWHDGSENNVKLNLDSEEALLEHVVKLLATQVKKDLVIDVFIFLCGKKYGGFIETETLGERALSEIGGILTALKEAKIEPEKPKKEKKNAAKT